MRNLFGLILFCLLTAIPLTAQMPPATDGLASASIISTVRLEALKQYVVPGERVDVVLVIATPRPEVRALWRDVKIISIEGSKKAEPQRKNGEAFSEEVLATLELPIVEAKRLKSLKGQGQFFLIRSQQRSATAPTMENLPWCQEPELPCRPTGQYSLEGKTMLLCDDGNIIEAPTGPTRRCVDL